MKRPLKILCVEDNRDEIGLLRHLLREIGMDVDVVFSERLRQACLLLETTPFDLILLDLSLPDAQGADTVVRMKTITPSAALVVLTDEPGEAVGVQCVERGAQDYLVKGHFDVSLLKRVLFYSIQRQHMTSDRINLVQTQKAILNILEDLENQKGELCREVRERTIIQKKLESANHESESFAHVVSHDLKAPLRAMVSLAQWLQDDYADKLDAKGKQHLHMLMIRAKRMNDMIDGVLRCSRIEGLAGERIRLNLKQLVRDTVDLLAPPPHITIHISSRMPTILGDRTRISQVFQNLIGNAIEYMDKPKGKIYVNCTAEKDDWLISVSDNGRGIAESCREKIFELFQTLAPKDQAHSTGIGLAVAKKIVESYGGRIWVDSEVGKSSTFFFTFPKKSGADSAAPDLSPRRVSSGTPCFQ